jgi:hypothetical protein
MRILRDQGLIVTIQGGGRYAAMSSSDRPDSGVCGSQGLPRLSPVAGDHGAGAWIDAAGPRGLTAPAGANPGHLVQPGAAGRSAEDTREALGAGRCRSVRPRILHTGFVTQTPIRIDYFTDCRIFRLPCNIIDGLGVWAFPMP